MALIFQYGSNLSSNRLNTADRMAGDAHVIGPAVTTDDFELVFDLWSTKNNCAAGDLIRGTGRKIWGVIYQIPDNLVTRSATTPAGRSTMDRVEGRNYERVKIQLRTTDGKPVDEEVFTYIGRQGSRDPSIRTSLEYVRHYFDGMREHNAPADYVEYVRGVVAANNPDLPIDLFSS
jgi:hypothetical protein